MIQNRSMTTKPDYRGYRFTTEIIAHTVSLYHRFTSSPRDVEELLAERGITLSYETVRQWCRTFGPKYARRIKKHQGPRSGRWFLDEVVVNANVFSPAVFRGKYNCQTRRTALPDVARQKRAPVERKSAVHHTR